MQSVHAHLCNRGDRNGRAISRLHRAEAAHRSQPAQAGNAWGPGTEKAMPACPTPDRSTRVGHRFPAVPWNDPARLRAGPIALAVSTLRVDRAMAAGATARDLCRGTTK